MAKYIYMVRHGEPEEGFTHRFLGRLNPGLSPRGVAQAKRAAGRIRELAPDRCLSSPLLRAKTTAEIIGGECGLPVEATDLLQEIDYGLLEGLRFQEAAALYPKATDSWKALSDQFSFPEGENFAAFTKRAAEIAELTKQSPAESILLVAHGGILRGVLCHLLGLPADTPVRFRLAYAALTTLELYESGPAVLTGFNAGMDAPGS